MNGLVCGMSSAEVNEILEDQGYEVTDYDTIIYAENADMGIFMMISVSGGSVLSISASVLESL